MLTLQFLLFTHSKDFSKNFQTEQQCKLAGLNWNYGRLLTELVRGLSFGFRPVLSVLFWVFFVFVNQDPGWWEVKTHTVTGRSQKQATSASHFTAVLPHRGFLHSYKQFNRILYEESTLVLLLHWTQTCELSERIRPTPLWPQLLVLLGVDSWGCRQPPCVRLQEECPNWPEEKFHWFKKKKKKEKGETSKQRQIPRAF